MQCTYTYIIYRVAYVVGLYHIFDVPWTKSRWSINRNVVEPAYVMQFYDNTFRVRTRPLRDTDLKKRLVNNKYSNRYGYYLCIIPVLATSMIRQLSANVLKDRPKHYANTHIDREINNQ